MGGESSRLMPFKGYTLIFSTPVIMNGINVGSADASAKLEFLLITREGIIVKARSH